MLGISAEMLEPCAFVLPGSPAIVSNETDESHCAGSFAQTIAGILVIVRVFPQLYAVSRKTD
jgi:hypothetical protein